MQPGHDAHVEALLQRLEPAQRHPDPGIGLARGNRLEQGLGRAREIDELDVEPVLDEDATLVGRRQWRAADGPGVPGELERLQLAGCPGSTTAQTGERCRSTEGGGTLQDGTARGRGGDRWASCHDGSPLLVDVIRALAQSRAMGQLVSRDQSAKLR